MAKHFQIPLELIESDEWTKEPFDSCRALIDLTYMSSIGMELSERELAVRWKIPRSKVRSIKCCRGTKPSSKTKNKPKINHLTQGDETTCPQTETEDKPKINQSETDKVQSVLDFYRSIYPRRLRGINGKSKEWGKIKARLSDGYSVEELTQAIEGNSKSEFHVNGKHNSLELIVRNAKQVDLFLEINQNPVLSKADKMNAGKVFDPNATYSNEF